jgi:hypothetical protein
LARCVTTRHPINKNIRMARGLWRQDSREDCLDVFVAPSPYAIETFWTKIKLKSCLKDKTSSPIPTVVSAARQLLLEVQEPLFYPCSTGESAEPSVLPYHAVAGDEQGERISPIGSPHCPAGPGIANRLGDIFIGARLAQRDLLQRLPDPHVKGAALQVQRRGEAGYLAREKGLDLRYDPAIEFPIRLCMSEAGR